MAISVVYHAGYTLHRQRVFIMLVRDGISMALLAFFSAILLNLGSAQINPVGASPKVGEITEPGSPHQIKGKVTQVLEAGGYTYAEVDTGEEKVWAASSITPLNVGDRIAFTTEMPMRDFHSSAMNRDFSMIYFVSNFITDESGPSGAGAGIAAAQQQPAAEETMVEGIEKLEGGNTIAELYANKQQLSGEAISVRGKVTKFTFNVMNRNWLHIKDSSTSDDLTITTDNTASVDDIVVIEGKLAVDKDFGFGYFYPLIVEDATVKKE